MKHSEIIFNIKNLLARGIQSDDEELKDTQIAFITNYYRAKLLRQEAERHANKLSTEKGQDLGKVSIIQADPHECCEIDLDCILRTEKPIPTTLELIRNKHGLTFVGTYGGGAFQETSFNRAQFDKYAPFTSKKPKWFFKNGYIYFLNAPGMLQYVNIQGHFEDPQEANQFRTCDCPLNEEACSLGYDYDYPLSLHQVDTLVKMIMESEMRIATVLPPDIDNNANDDN
jgi:hypothetical protein